MREVTVDVQSMENGADGNIPSDCSLDKEVLCADEFWANVIGHALYSVAGKDTVPWWAQSVASHA